MIQQLFKDTFSLFPSVVKNSVVVLLVTFLGCEALQHYFLLMMGVTKSIEGANFLAMVGQLLTALLEFVILTMLVPLRVMEIERSDPPTGFWAFTNKHVRPLALESIRALAITLLWTLLLILPGIFKYLRYLFVPYVVVADPQYDRGERDALEYSNLLVKGITIPMLLLIIFLTGVDACRGSLRESYPLTDAPLLAIGFGLVFFSFSIFANIFLFRLYQMRAAKISGGS